MKLIALLDRIRHEVEGEASDRRFGHRQEAKARWAAIARLSCSVPTGGGMRETGSNLMDVLASPPAMATLAFSMSESFSLPDDVSHHYVMGRHLFIAVKTPAWVVLDDQEAEVFERLQRGATLKEARLTFESLGLETPAATSKLQQLIRTLLIHNLSADAPVDDQSRYARLQIHVTNRCNLRCPHCYVSSGEAFPTEMGLAEWTSLLHYMRDHFSQVNVTISGGEPLMVPWLDDLLQVAKRECNFDTAAITNGLLWTRRRSSDLAPLLDYVAVSFDGATAEVHDRIRGPGTFRKTLATLHLMNEVGLRIVLNITLMRSNRTDLLENLYPMVRSLPFEVDVDLANYIPEGRGEDMPEEALSAGEFRDTLSSLVAPFLKDEWKSIPISRRLNCGYGTAFAVYANGDVSPCLSPRFIRGNIIEMGVGRLFDSILTEADRSAVDNLPLCRTCDMRYLCGGRCHLNHLIPLGVMRQNDCPGSYRESFRRGLVHRFDAQQRAFANGDRREVTTGSK
ncbi:MAG: radical SAM protein [Actinomycetota bacterium]